MCMWEHLLHFRLNRVLTLKPVPMIIDPYPGLLCFCWWTACCGWSRMGVIWMASLSWCIRCIHTTHKDNSWTHLNIIFPDMLKSTTVTNQNLNQKEITFNVRTFKLSGTCCGRNLNGPKSLKLQTFTKNYIFSVLCNIEIRTKNSLKDNKIVYTYTKEQILQMKIFFDYFVVKCKISYLLYIFWNSKGLTPSFFLTLETCWFF
jgi:hypothetical protein